MTLTPQIVALLRCPETGQRLALASAEAVETLETHRLAKTLHLSAVQPQLDFDAPIEAALRREDGHVYYAVQNGVPLLLPGHGIAVA